jgi:hypothetical protein
VLLAPQIARQSPWLTQLSNAGVQCDLEPIIESEIERDLFEAERPTEKVPEAQERAAVEDLNGGHRREALGVGRLPSIGG